MADKEEKCTICNKICSSPILLQCFHVYCQECLKNVAGINRSDGITCPCCSHVTPNSATGLTGLPSVKEGGEEEAIAADYPPSTSRGRSPCYSLSGISDVGDYCTDSFGDIPVCCTKHDGREMELYCKTCAEPICLKCAIKGSKHYKHDYEAIKNASKRVKRELIRTSLQPVESQLISATDSLDQIGARCKEITDRQKIIETHIEDTFTKCENELKIRKVDLLSHLHQVTLGKLGALEVQQEKMEATQVELGSSVGSIRKSLSASDKQILMIRTSITKVSGQSSNVLQPDMLKPITESDIVFAYEEYFIDQCKMFGRVFAAGSPDPSKCYITSKSLESAASSLVKGTVVLQVVDFDGKPCKNVIKSVESELVCEISKIITKCDVEKSKKQGQYKISYHPSSKGKHHLHVKVEGQHVQGSPFTVIVKTSVHELGTPVVTFEDLGSPRGITINQKGEIIVAEEDASCISIFSPSGEKIQSFGLSGSGEGQFKSPRGVTVDDQGDIIVADSNNHRIQKFSSEGQFIVASNSSTSDSTGVLQPSFPTGIAFNHSNKKLYMTNIAHCIHVFNSDLSVFTVFGKKGKGKGQLMTPWNIACDSTGNVYVTDTGNHRIQVFTEEGKYLRKFGSQGSENGELSWPDGIAVHDGMVFVSEYRNYRISIFTCEGQFIFSFGTNGGGLGEFKDLFGLTVDSSGLVYVCDSGNNRVQVF